MGGRKKLNRILFSENLSELIFRTLFVSIFVILGAEHLLMDEIIQFMVPSWVPMPLILSKVIGFVLLVGSTLIFIGYKVQFAARLLGFFLFSVTVLIHIPALWILPKGLPGEWKWIWDVLQRSNIVKNLCLLGVCFHLIHHKLGYYSLESYLVRKKDMP